MLGVHINHKMYVVYEANREEDISSLIDRISTEIEWRYGLDIKEKKRTRRYFANYPISFDIETSSFYQDLNGNFHTNEEVEQLLDNTYNDVMAKTKSITKAKIEQVRVKETYIPCSTMYIWQMAFGIGDCVIIGRTWNEWVDFMYTLKQAFNLSNTREMIIYTHNLKYEFSFLKRNFIWSNDKNRTLLTNKIVYYASPTKCYYVDPNRSRGLGCMDFTGFMFKDSLALAGVKLEHLPDIMTKYANKMQKLTGNLNYSQVRHSKTQLSEQELAYCIADVLLLNWYIQEKMEENTDSKGPNLHKIPLTKTGEVRRVCRDRLYFTNPNFKSRKDDKYKDYTMFLEDMKFDYATYQQIKRAFQGGFTHANRIHVEKVLRDCVRSIDIKSAYAAVMVCKKFPMTPYEKVTLKSKSDFNYYIENKACLFDVTLNDLRPKQIEDIDFDYIDNIISTYKLEEFGRDFPDCAPIYPIDGDIDEDKKWYKNNGRLRYAERITLTVNEIDWIAICKFYDFDKDKVHIDNFRIANKGYLPKSLIEYILELFSNKEMYKEYRDTDTKEGLLYKIAKIFINSLYGMVATDILKETYYIDDEEDQNIKKVNGNIKGDKLNAIRSKELEEKSSFLCYQWSHAVTSYVRYNLYQAIMASGENHVYSDTDSEKFIQNNKTLQFVNEYNMQVDIEMNECFKYYHMLPDSHKVYNEDTKKWSCLGYFEHENKGKPYKVFITCGAKRYLYEDETGYHITVAGLRKEAIDYLVDKYGDKLVEVFAKSEVEVDRDNSGCTIATYINDETQGEIIDYMGNRSTFDEMSSVHLEKSTFKMKENKDYMKMMELGEIEGWRGL